ncbi:hypothetical protein A2U01_0029758 [Trifolium medium]|uniref:Uncharacterized protein n=1 Tax=Trifolium medium TaxID=97028 RepID=A0A392PB54_9FABA|nr:hypothetical protein [Trifolium medium]
MGEQLFERPLVHVLSMNVQPKNENKDSPLAMYGEICDFGATEVHELFNRDIDVGEILGTSNKLSLSGFKIFMLATTYMYTTKLDKCGVVR